MPNHSTHENKENHVKNQTYMIGNVGNVFNVAIFTVCKSLKNPMQSKFKQIISLSIYTPVISVMKKQPFSTDSTIGAMMHLWKS
jgi:hypothetical protein